MYAEPLEDRLLLSGNDAGAVRLLIADLRGTALGPAGQTPNGVGDGVPGVYRIQNVNEVRGPDVVLTPLALGDWRDLFSEAQTGSLRAPPGGTTSKGPTGELAAPFFQYPAGLPDGAAAYAMYPVAAPPDPVQGARHAPQLPAADPATDWAVMVDRLTPLRLRELRGSFYERAQSYRSEIAALAFRKGSNPSDKAAAQVDALSLGGEGTGLPNVANSDTGLPALFLGKPDGTSMALTPTDAEAGDPSAGTWVRPEKGAFAIVQPADARVPVLLVTVDLSLPAPQADLVPLRDTHLAVVATYLAGGPADAGSVDPGTDGAAPTFVSFVIGLDGVPGGSNSGPCSGADSGGYSPLSLDRLRQVLDRLFSQGPPGEAAERSVPQPPSADLRPGAPGPAGVRLRGGADLAGRQLVERLLEVGCGLESGAAAAEPATESGHNDDQGVPARLRFWVAGLCAFGLWQSLGRVARVYRRPPRPGLVVRQPSMDGWRRSRIRQNAGGLMPPVHRRVKAY